MNNENQAQSELSTEERKIKILKLLELAKVINLKNN